MFSLAKETLRHFYHSIEFIIIICYLAFGCFVFTGRTSGASYIQIFGNPFIKYHFVGAFIYPTFLIAHNYIYQQINTSNSFILRIGNRYKLALTHLLSMLFVTIYMFIIMLLLTLIFTNLVSNNGLFITYDLGLNVNDLIVLIASIIKLFFNLLVLGLINIVGQNILGTKKGIILPIIYFLLTMVSAFNYPTNSTLLNIFNPGFHSHGILEARNIYEAINYGIIYFLVMFIILIILNFLSIKYKKINL